MARNRSTVGVPFRRGGKKRRTGPARGREGVCVRAGKGGGRDSGIERGRSHQKAARKKSRGKEHQNQIQQQKRRVQPGGADQTASD